MATLTSRRDVALNVLICLSLSGCTLSTTQQTAAEPAKLEVEITRVEESPTSVSLTLKNSGNSRIAVCPCLGKSNLFLRLDVHNSSGERVGYPEWDFYHKKSFTRLVYECLAPGEAVSISFDLTRWHPIWGSRPTTWSETEDLLGGVGRFEVRARYSDSGKRHKWRCPGFQGEIVSDWITVEVPEDFQPVITSHALRDDVD